MKRLLLLLLFLSTPLFARELADVMLKDIVTVSGKELKLNGAGIRTFTVMNVKVYVASFYASAPLSSEKEVLAAAGPLRFEFTFVREFNQKKTQDAWRWQFKQSVSYAYPGFEKDAETFASSLGALKKFGLEAVEIDGNDTRVYNEDKLAATIAGKDFQKAFLSMWFGSKPVMTSLKTQLLGKSS